MSSIDRRNLLKAVSCAGLALALPFTADAAAHAATLSDPDLESLRSRWVDSLTGRRLITASPATYKDAIASLDKGAAGRLAAIAPTATQYFGDHNWSTQSTDIANSNAMRLNYGDLETLALAWATPTSQYYGSSTVLTAVTDGLSHMYDTVYNEQTVWWGNWWSWIIGAAKPLADVMAILHEQLPQTDIDRYCAAMDHFVPNRDPSLQIHPSGVITSVGANRVDICQGIIVRSIVQPDTAYLSAAVSALSPTWQYVTTGNGFFQDGSFIQHSTIGYTGTYGTVLLGGLAKLFGLVAGSPFDITDQTKSNLLDSVEGSFAPLMFNGQMMDSVRGRAVSRIGERSIDDGDDLIEYTLRLADAADATTARRWRGLCKQWIQSNSAETITQTTNVVRLSLVTDLMTSSVAPVADVSGPRLFPAMDRLVYRAPDNAWALCLAMCSNRIAWSESTAAENFDGSKTSQGMSYVYLPDDDNHFDDDYWATSDLTAPVGTTVDLTPLPPCPEGQWGATCPQNEWTGGVTLDNLALAGMHLVAPGGTGLTARKTWLVTPDAVFNLGSDISTQSTAEVRTVVEHRNLGTSGRKLLVDGAALTSTGAPLHPRWAHLEGVGGYVFLDDAPNVLADVSDHSGTWRRNNTGTGTGTSTVIHREYATLAYTHGSGTGVAGASYAYVGLPTATEDQTRSRAGSIDQRTVVRNDDVAQGINYGHDTVAANFWKPGTVDTLTSDGAACVIARSSNKGLDLAVADPTQQRSSMTLTIRQGSLHRVVGPDARRVSLTRHGNVVTLIIDCRGLGGAGLRFSLAH